MLKELKSIWFCLWKHSNVASRQIFGQLLKNLKWFVKWFSKKASLDFEKKIVATLLVCKDKTFVRTSHTILTLIQGKDYFTRPAACCFSFWACIISCLFISASSRRFFFSSASLAFFSASSLRSLSSSSYNYIEEFWLGWIEMECFGLNLNYLDWIIIDSNFLWPFFQLLMNSIRLKLVEI